MNTCPHRPWERRREKGGDERGREGRRDRERAIDREGNEPTEKDGKEQDLVRQTLRVR